MIKTTHRISGAYVLGALALFVALGGTAMAQPGVRALITGKDVRNGSLTGRDVRNRSITAADLAPGVVRAGQQGSQGPAGERGPAGPAGRDLADAKHVHVRSEGTPAQNGAALRAALASITDASATKPYVLQLAPGSYELGGTTLAMKPDVSINGAGAEATRITGDIGSHFLSQALVLGAARTVLRGVTITNRGNVDATLHVTLYVGFVSSMRIEDAVLEARAITNQAFALIPSDSTVEVIDSRLESDSAGRGFAAYVIGTGKLWVRGSDLVARGGEAYSLSSEDPGSSAVVESSALESTGRAVIGPGGEAWVAASRVDGGSDGQVTCVGAYNRRFQTLNTRCN
jgi:hypothetical protein